MATVVLVENPIWYQKETSIPNCTGGYIVIYRFGFDQNTKCHLNDNTQIKPSDALEGALNGWYKCHLIITSSSVATVQSRTAVVERIIKHKKDNSTLGTAVGLSAVIALIACYFSK